MLEGVAQAFDHLHHQPRGLQGLDLLANPHDVAEIPALDELHHQVERPAVGGDVVDGHDVGMPQREPQLALAHELRGLLELLRLGGVAEFLAQDFEGDDLAGLAVHGAEHAGESAGPDCIKHLVGTVEIARRLAFDEAFELVVGHVLAAEELLLDLLQRRLTAADGPPHLLELPIIQKFQVECPLQELFSAWLPHTASWPSVPSNPQRSRARFPVPLPSA